MYAVFFIQDFLFVPVRFPDLWNYSILGFLEEQMDSC